MPPVPPKGLLKMKKRELLEEVNILPFPLSVVMLLMILGNAIRTSCYP